VKDVFKMWKETKMVVLVALCAGIYAAVLIPFKGFVIIPGFTEFRPASGLPIMMGLLFGPAGAWGAAIGNLIGDFFGSLGIGSTFGFVGNFLFAYIPYKIWRNIGILKADEQEPSLKSGKQIGMFVLVSFLGAAACALFIAWGLDLLQMVPFAALGTIITANNFIPSIVLGIPLTLVLYPRIKKWHLLWTDIMPEEDIPEINAKTRISAILMIILIPVGLVGGLFFALGGGQEMFAAGFGAGGAGNMGVAVVAGVGSIGILLAGLIE
jgi:energy-coupling factor transport system substrate-specific component